MRSLLSSILAQPDSPRKTAAIAAWFQALYAGREVPILVGGAAVELYTGGAYTTGDLDFVGSVPEDVARSLEANGFEKEGRHWIHKKGEVFIELPGASLGFGERSARIAFGEQSVLVVGPEEILVDRLAAWRFWHSAVDGVNAFLLWTVLGPDLSPERLTALARNRKTEKALGALRQFVRDLAGKRPSEQELETWSSQRI